MLNSLSFFNKCLIKREYDKSNFINYVWLGNRILIVCRCNILGNMKTISITSTHVNISHLLVLVNLQEPVMYRSCLLKNDVFCVILMLNDDEFTT